MKMRKVLYGVWTGKPSYDDDGGAPGARRVVSHGKHQAKHGSHKLAERPRIQSNEIGSLVVPSFLHPPMKSTMIFCADHALAFRHNPSFL